MDYVATEEHEEHKAMKLAARSDPWVDMHMNLGKTRCSNSYCPSCRCCGSPNRSEGSDNAYTMGRSYCRSPDWQPTCIQGLCHCGCPNMPSPMCQGLEHLGFPLEQPQKQWRNCELIIIHVILYHGTPFTSISRSSSSLHHSQIKPLRLTKPYTQNLISKSKEDSGN